MLNGVVKQNCSDIKDDITFINASAIKPACHIRRTIPKQRHYVFRQNKQKQQLNKFGFGN